ncbi:MAG: hypothetical protein U1E26_01505 [Coriobacteriia bacterium]|nr:hypothetical protein [Coriobacteriia bacterium]
MNALLTSRKALIALAVVLAVLAVAVPTCRMVGCSMDMGGARPFGMQMSAGLFSDCGGEYVFSSSPAAVVPAGADSLTLSLLGALVAAVALMMPAFASKPVFVVELAPPPPPEPPLGQRLRL